MKVYIVMEATWKDYYSRDLEKIDICDVYSSEDSAIYALEKLVKERYDWSLNKYHEEPIIAKTDYEKIVWDGDKHGYARYWIKEKVLRGARKDD